jgi:hypothetical protein
MTKDLELIEKSLRGCNSRFRKELFESIFRQHASCLEGNILTNAFQTDNSKSLIVSYFKIIHVYT